MGRGLRHDLVERLESSLAQRLCVIPESQSDAHRLRAALRTGHVISPFPQLYVLEARWKSIKRSEQERIKIRSLAKLHPDWTFTGVSAAVIHGLWVTYSLMDQIHVATSPKAHSRSCGAIVRHEIAYPGVTLVDGVSVTSLERTVFDCLRSVSFRTALPIADSALRFAKTDIEHFTNAFLRFPHSCANYRRASEVMAFANGLSENGGESTARAVMHEQGYLIPELQVEVANCVDPDSAFRVDYRWKLDGGEVYGELDGREKYTNKEMTGGRDVVDVLADERLRESYVSGNGAKILRFSYREVMDVTKFRHLLDSFGIPSGFPVPYVASLENPINQV